MATARRAVPTVLLAVGAVLAVRAGHRAQLRWGATPGEQVVPLPGDDVLPGADVVATRAVTISAPPTDVWPWLVQLGQGRAGFYSYELLENLAGCDIRNADRVVPEWQHLAVGDEVRLHPEVPLTVAVLEPGRSLVLRAAAADGDGAPYDFVWAFVVQPLEGGRSRLLVRERYGLRVPWVARPLVAVLSWASFVMTRRMLRGVRDRAEPGSPQPSGESPGSDVISCH